MYNSGITTLNLAVTGKPDEFAAPGTTVSYIGQTNVGKTVLALTTMAASFYATRCEPVFYALEPNLLIDIERLYGKKFAKALQVIADLKMPLEAWQADIRARLKAARKPLIVTLDSTDALKCVADLAALDGKGGKTKGGKAEVEIATDESDIDALTKKGTRAKMGGEAARAWSQCLSEVTRAVHDNQGLLILTSQVRTKPGVLFGSPFYRSCGMALDYFSEIRIWMWGSSSEKIEDVSVGAWTKFEVKRNKVTGDARTIYAPIYPAYGIDDTRAMLHFLADTGSGASWANASNMAAIKVGDQELSMAEMAAFYEESQATRDVLKHMVTEAWRQREARIAAELLAGRKPRFA